MALDRRPGRKPIPVKKASSKPAISPAPPKICAKCAGEVPAGASFCEACGTPLKAGAKPKRSLVEVRRSVEKGKNSRTIASGRNTLMWVAILNLGLGLLVYLLMAGQYHTTPNMDPDLMIEYQKAGRLFFIICLVSFFLPGVIFLGLYVWARTNPLPATMSGLIIYITFLIAGIALNPETAKGILAWVIRIAIIGSLWNAVKSAQTEKRARERELEKERLRREREAQAQPDSEDEVDAGAAESTV